MVFDFCVCISSLNDIEVDIDVFFIIIFFNFGRSYEYEGDVDRVIEIYECFLSRYSNYMDVCVRFVYIKFCKNFNKDGFDVVVKFY